MAYVLRIALCDWISAIGCSVVAASKLPDGKMHLIFQMISGTDNSL